MRKALTIHLGSGEITQKSCDSGCLSMAGDQYVLIYDPEVNQYFIEYQATIGKIGSWEERWSMDDAKEHVPQNIWDEAMRQQDMQAKATIPDEQT